MDGYRHHLPASGAPPLNGNASKVVRSIGTVIRRIAGLRELWDECSLDHILSRYYDPEILGLSQDTATVAIIEGLSSASKPSGSAHGDAAAASAAVAVIEKLAERGIRPSVPLSQNGNNSNMSAGLMSSPEAGTGLSALGKSGAGLLMGGSTGSSAASGTTPTASHRSFYQTISETTDFALDNPAGGLGMRLGGHGNRLRTMSDVPLHATSNDLHHYTAPMTPAMIMPVNTTDGGVASTAATAALSAGVRGLRRDSPSAVNVPQIDLDDLLSPPGTKQKATSALRNAVRGDLIGRVRQRVVSSETGRQRSRSEMDARWLKGMITSSPGAAAKQVSMTNPTDLRPDWMRSPQYLGVIENKLEDPSLYYVEWNILGLQRALSMKKLSRVVSPRFTLTPNLSFNAPSLSSLLLMITFSPRSSPTAPLYISISVSLPGEVEAKYRVFHPTYLSESRWHSFCQTPWATSDSVPIPNPLPDVLTVGVVIEALRSPSGANAASKCQTPTINSAGADAAESAAACATTCPSTETSGSASQAAALQISSTSGSDGLKVNRGAGAWTGSSMVSSSTAVRNISGSSSAGERIESLPSLTDLINLAATSYSTRPAGGAGTSSATGPIGAASPSHTASTATGATLFLSTPPGASEFSSATGQTSSQPAARPNGGAGRGLLGSPPTTDGGDPGATNGSGPEYEEHRLFELLQSELFDAEDDFLSDDVEQERQQGSVIATTEIGITAAEAYSEQLNERLPQSATVQVASSPTAANSGKFVGSGIIDSCSSLSTAAIPVSSGAAAVAVGGTSTPPRAQAEEMVEANEG